MFKLVVLCLFFRSVIFAEEVMIDWPHPVHLNERVQVIYEKGFFSLRIHPQRPLTFIEKIYFKIESSEKNFFFSMMKNARFLWVKKKFCLDYQNKISPIRSVKIEYSYLLSMPTLKKIVIDLENEKEPVEIKANTAEGFFSLYELSLGFGTNVHSNIRPHDENFLRRQNPAIELVPSFLARLGPLFVNKDGAGVVVFPSENFSLLLTTIRDGEPYKRQGFKERTESYFAGPFVKLFFFEIYYLFDLYKTTNGGSLFKMTAAPEFHLKSYWIISPRPYVQYWNWRYVDYYFGVEKTEPERTYTPHSTMNYGMAVRNIFKTKWFDTIISPELKIYGSEVSHSPIVTQSYEYRLVAAFLYRIF